MAKDETRFVDADTLKADTDALAAIEDMTDYDPKDAFTKDKLDAGSKAIKTADDDLAKAEAKVKTARDGVVAAQWGFHNLMLGAKQQIIAQYGDDSNQAQAIGLTKKSERAKPARPAKPAVK